MWLTWPAPRGYRADTMPRGYHPCFSAQSWLPSFHAILTFDSDGSRYEYTAVPPPIWDAYSLGTLNGEDFNATVRATIGPFIRLP